LEMVCDVCPRLFGEYMAAMRIFPKEFGRQIGSSRSRKMALDAGLLIENFGVYGLAVCIEFWHAKACDADSEVVAVIRVLADLAIARLPEFLDKCASQEEFEFLLYLSLNMQTLAELGVSETATAALHKSLFEFADEHMIRMGLIGSAEATLALPILERLLEVTHFGPA